jgi:hypothetical protein
MRIVHGLLNQPRKEHRINGLELAGSEGVRRSKAIATQANNTTQQTIKQVTRSE